MNHKSAPQHYYMAAVLLTYARPLDDTTPNNMALKQRHMNVVLELPRKAITSATINNARMAVLQRLMDENQVTADQVRDVVFLGFSYLGNLRPGDFYDLQAPSRIEQS